MPIYDPDSYSVPGNARAAAWTRFMQHHLAGQVLDVGCGPQPLPMYLVGYPLDRIAGLDPIAAPHPFAFKQGRGELIPWPTGSFNRVICATALDHMDSPVLAVAEMWRVLQPTGRLLLWEGVLPPDRAGPDAHHAFRFTQESLFATVGAWFEPVIMSWYRVGMLPGCAECFGLWTPRSWTRDPERDTVSE